MGPTPLAGSLAWEGVEEEEVQGGRGVGVDEACVHPPPVTGEQNIYRGPPLFPNFEIYLGPLQSPLGRQFPPCPPPPVPVGVRGWVKPPYLPNQKHLWARFCLLRDPSCFPAPPPCARRCVWGG